MAANSRAFKMIGVSVTIGGLLAWAGSWTGAQWQGVPVFALSAALAFAIQWLMFIPAYIFQTERYYDLVGSFTYLTCVWMAWYLSGGGAGVALLIALMVTVWAVRLGSFLFRRISEDGSDHRFDAIKPHFFRFLATWTLQGLWVAFTAASALAVISSPEAQQSLLRSSTAESAVVAIGGLVWLSGFVIEVVADQQKRHFRANPQNQGQFIRSGLWARSRHPNYFGEIVLWLGIAIMALPFLSGWQYLCLISPIFVALLLTRVSGVPMLEAAADKRWQGDPDYESYKASTPVLVPKLSA